MLARNTARCARMIRGALGEKVVTGIARDTGFARRLRKFTPLRTARTFLVGLAAGNTNTLADLLRLFTDLGEEPMSSKPFHDRLATRGAVPGATECAWPGGLRRQGEDARLSFR